MWKLSIRKDRVAIMARTRLPPADRRAQLVAHAIAACADHGIARATQAQVAARAGVSVSAVYSYFRTRADLVAAVLDAVAAAITAMVAAADAPGTPPVAALTTLARHTAAMAVEQPDTVRVWLDWSTGVRADVWPGYLLLQGRLQAHVRAILSRDAPASPALSSAARLFVGGAHTLALLQFERVSEAELALFIASMVAGAMAAAG
jgi:TetR/AcrR family transcriptional regulator, hemagglutinin/protease regulatory protein